MTSTLALRPSHSNHTPQKLFYRINEVAKVTGLKPYVLRYWETEFRELAPAKDRSDQRRYRPEDIEVVRAIRRLLYEERYTIKGARQRLRIELRKSRHNGSGGDPSDAANGKAQSVTPARTAPETQRLATSLRNLRGEVDSLLALVS